MRSRIAIVAIVAAAVGFVGWEAVRGHQHSAEAQRLMPKLTTFVERKYQPHGAVETVGGLHRLRLFCELRYLGNSDVAARFEVYVWEGCQAYWKAKGRLVKAEGWSVPAVISVARRGPSFRPVAEKQPGDGPDYARDIAKFFPGGVQDRVWAMDGHPGTLFDDLDQRARRELG